MPECPKCHYSAVDELDDLVVKGECPACGIIVEKYLKIMRGEPLADSVVADTVLADEVTSMVVYEQPTIKHLFLGALGSYLACACIVSIIRMIANLYTVVRFSPSSITTANALTVSFAMGDNAYFWEQVTKIFAPLLVWVLVPIFWGRTWGQAIVGLWLARDDGEEVGAKTVLLRAFGNAIILLSCGLLLLVPVFRKDKRGVADFVSRAELVGDPDEQRSLGWRLAGLFTACVLLLGIQVMIGRMISESYSKQIESLKTDQGSSVQTQSKTGESSVFSQQVNDDRARIGLVILLLSVEQSRILATGHYETNLLTFADKRVQIPGPHISDDQKDMIQDLVNRAELVAFLDGSEVIIETQMSYKSWWSCGTKRGCKYRK